MPTTPPTAPPNTPPWHGLLGAAKSNAGAGRFAEARALCEQVAQSYPDDGAALLDTGGLLLSCGLLSEAEQVFLRAQALAPGDIRARVSLANVAAQRADHGTARRLYAGILGAAPDHPVIRRNALTTQEYDPAATDGERLAAARAWGRWAARRAGGPHSRPVMAPATGRPLRVGYVSADLCQHTVGLFVKDVLAGHDPARVQAVVYSAGSVDDWVTDAIRHTTTFRDVRALDDAALARAIRFDRLDVLVDLSGHTSGSRLTALAHRPAPVMVSWLGYFATTGLPCLDAVLLDDAHAPPGMEAGFTESIVRMTQGRLCYAPVPFAPPVADPPHRRNGHVTFGSFNNTAKLNEAVLAVWARVLGAVPDSRLVLKWRTFNDTALCERIRATFQAHGIAPHRIDLRGPSFHKEMLAEYGDIDIALDPFPFTGGLTSCEALWMGVPVVTWPQGRVVSRQTFAFLSQIGLSELAARDADDYVRIASDLAGDRARMATVRASLRNRMRTSPLCDVSAFTRELEDTFIGVFEEASRSE
ncbi:tetratricopeptide repeat protein [Roseospira marina]|uniref:Tetratricopeptide repeat protein n=1 Tax=Roseospira marina TaxID=140057 RepID=A0A5M6IE73_9PROT|nr:tetratricopeptide repeat protein [Roseospira marina]KAA5606079.1 tetratricopeptide repeat protein [Roseospira marina]MBB4313055.1 putative O-linked N-acetylglucosamine transferase (SPINDLY family) [Roseospira marina]MBB5086204.1 putative O-linked N-acetylglucosamine transferase (SPINDLY family) [Roseospira marina]